MASYPAALGQRPLEVREAYQVLEQYGADFGREPLLLMMHASVPETLRPDLLHLIRLNFLPSSGADLSLEADVLFSPVTTALGGGYYRIDPQVRWHCLALLRSLYRSDTRPRTRRVAELLWRYVASMERRANRDADPQLAEYLDIQRWVALAFLDPASASQAFADALRQAGESRAPTAVLRLGGLASAIELPLVNEQDLLAYAQGLDALVTGDEERGRSILEALGDEEICIGGIVLKAPTELLRALRPAAAAGEPGATPQLPPKRCLLVKGYGRRVDASDGRAVDLDASNRLIRETLKKLGLECGHMDGNGTEYERILDAELVIVDLTAAAPGLHLLLGVCITLRPRGLLLIANRGVTTHAPETGLPLLRYTPEDLTGRLDEAVSRALDQGDSQKTREVPSPLYGALPRLDPPARSEGGKPIDFFTLNYRTAPESEEAAHTCMILQAFGRKSDPDDGRTLDLDSVFPFIRQAVERAGLISLRADVHDSGSVALLPQRLRLLQEANLLIADITTENPDVLFELGIRVALRPFGTLIVGEKRIAPPRQLAGVPILRYVLKGGRLDGNEAEHFRGALLERIHDFLSSPRLDSPIYSALPFLRPPLPLPEPKPKIEYSAEIDALLAEIDNRDTDPPRRLEIGNRLAELGDPRPGIGVTEIAAISHFMGFVMHQPRGNLLRMLSVAEWDARQILLTYERPVTFAERYQDVARFCICFSGALLEQLQDPVLVNRCREFMDIPQMLERYKAADNVELSGTGYYHPIFPLIPEGDWWDQIVRGRDKVAEVFGRTPEVFWPPDMGFSMAMVPYLAEAGYKQVLCDGVNVRAHKDASPALVLYRPHLADQNGARIVLVPRDGHLSQAQEAGMDPTWFQEEVARKSSGLRNPVLVTTWTSGENGAWFRQVDEASNFWGYFFAPYMDRVRSGRTILRPTSLADFLRRVPVYEKALAIAGTWAHSGHDYITFDRWAGSKEQQAVLNDILAISKEFEEAKKRAGPNPSSMTAQRLAEARDLILEAEATDTFFWGDSSLPRAREAIDYARKILRKIDLS